MEGEKVEIQKASMKEIKLKWNGYSPSFFLLEGHKKWDLDTLIRSLFGYESSVTTVGFIEINPQDPTVDIGPLIPIPLLERRRGFDMMSEEKLYRPQFHFYSSNQVANSAREKETEKTGNELPPVTDTPIPPPPAHTPNIYQYDATDPWQNFEYFHQYGKLNIHTEMLKDEARTKAYQEAIFKHADIFKDKVVMDLGTGTGILAIFCAKAGASRVYAVEASNLADWTELVMASNGLSGVVKVLKGRIEELVLPEKVDIIISEWMGLFLIFESMLESLLFARDNWLKPDGLMMPTHASIHLAPVSMEDYYSEKVNFYQKVWDVDMSVLMPYAKKCAFEKLIIDKAVKPEQVISEPIAIKFMNLKVVPIWEPYEKTIVKFDFQIKKDGNMHGFVSWFDVAFRTQPRDPNEVILSTSPWHKDTHWRQDLFMFDNPIPVKEGQIVKGTIRYQRNPDLLRHLIIDISCVVDGTGDAQSKRFYVWGNE